MKKLLLMIAALCVTAGAASLASCEEDTPEPEQEVNHLEGTEWSSRVESPDTEEITDGTETDGIAVEEWYVYELVFTDTDYIFTVTGSDGWKESETGTYRYDPSTVVLTDGYQLTGTGTVDGGFMTVDISLTSDVMFDLELVKQ
ncbi:MAG: hypothetical protein LBU97_03675 [Alistipes sp.]|jgi:opacity protein-like surface antigen|nr:hypothetical protein [Alistipes sp.]